VDYLDHKNINELPPFDKELNPSAEEMAGFFFHEVGSQINNDVSRCIKFVSGKPTLARRPIRLIETMPQISGGGFLKE